jgi:purine-binding chemotaxis protein CheW
MEKNIEFLQGKYLTFKLADEDYGVGILKVKEIIGIMAITPIPQSPLYVKGVINLRGKVIPVIDLRMKLGIQINDFTEKSCVIVVEIANLQKQIIPMGCVVDEVSEVVNIKSSDIEESPNFGTKLKTDFILGIAKISGSIKMLLDIDEVICQADL